MQDEGLLAFQKLDVYRAAKEMARRVQVAKVRDAELRDQATRAAKRVFPRSWKRSKLRAGTEGARCMVEDCRTVENYSALLAESNERPVFLFKHSTSCPISAGRWRLLQAYADRESRAAFYRLLVIQDRPVSTHVTQESGVRHQSPQAILFSGGMPVWDASHYRITEEDMASALERALG